MKVRIVECVGASSGNTYWQVQKKRWWWLWWVDFGPMQRLMGDAERIAKVAKSPLIIYPKV